MSDPQYASDLGGALVDLDGADLLDNDGALVVEEVLLGTSWSRPNAGVAASPFIDRSAT